MPADEFDAWLAREAAPAPQPRRTSARGQGSALFLASGCGACHAVRGTPAAGTIGPDLTHLGVTRARSARTRCRSTAANLARFIADGQQVKPGNRMPPFRIFSSDQRDALAAYLLELAVIRMTAPIPAAELPNPAPRPAGELEELKRLWAPPKGWRIVSAVNNTVIGYFYIGTAFLFFLLAGILALLMRTQLAVPSNTFLSQETYNQIFTMHGTVMMFLFAVPASRRWASCCCRRCSARATCRFRGSAPSPSGPISSAASSSSARCSSTSRRPAAGSCIRR